jgi:hypothetical protein
LEFLFFFFHFVCSFFFGNSSAAVETTLRNRYVTNWKHQSTVKPVERFWVSMTVKHKTGNLSLRSAVVLINVQRFGVSKSPHTHNPFSCVSSKHCPWPNNGNPTASHRFAGINLNREREIPLGCDKSEFERRRGG